MLSLSPQDKARYRLMARAERERRLRRRLREVRPESTDRTLPDAWRAWLAVVSPGLVHFAERHERFWNHVESIDLGAKPRSYIAPRPRKGGKSSSGEHAVAYLAERKKRRLCLYVCEKQSAANDHVAAIETLFGRIGGDLAQVATNTMGYSRGWKASRKQTASGFTLIGYGLDSAERGVKIDDVVPDLIVLDDIDHLHDTLAATKKKVETITQSILPMATDYAAVFGLQNLISPNGVFARLVDGRADFLLDRIVDGPYRAIEGIITQQRYVEALERTVPWIIGGEATWAGQPVEACQNYILTYGWRAFDREMQHNVKDVEGALWTTETINTTRESSAPPLTRIAVGVDPATTSKGSSNETGIIGCGRTANRHGYVLADRSGILSPAKWGRRAVLLLDELTAKHQCPGVIVAERNQGGEMVGHVIKNATEKLFQEGLRPSKNVSVKLVHASQGKRARAEPVSQMYDEAAVHHVGSLPGLEDQMTTWNASDGSESPDRVDGLVWGMKELGISRETRMDYSRI